MIEFLLTIAVYHAPVVFQETGHNPKADAFTRMDFDGDFVSDNNWKNAERYPTPAFAYSDVFETHTHYFIFYAYFHAKDYARFCIPLICHENDLEGALLVVRKNESKFGYIEMMQTLAHNRIHTYPTPMMVPVNPESDIMGRTERPAIRIEKGGHGIWGYEPSILQDIQSKKKKYLVYSIGDQSDDPDGAREGSYSYQLLSIRSEMWERRMNTGPGQYFLKFYNYNGSRFSFGSIPLNFAGKKWSAGRANPPWAWYDHTRRDVKRGDWFLDPAFFVLQTMKKLGMVQAHEEYSTEYLNYSYLPN